ncbi:hypothetical protein Tco_0559545 [Tanacetum coccineum]
MWTMLNYFGKTSSDQIDNKAYKKQEKMYYPRFTKVIIHYFLTQDKTLSWRNKIGMHTSKDDYLINSLRFVSAKEETPKKETRSGCTLPDSLTSPEMKEPKAYKTYIGFASGVTPPKKARKFKKPATPKLTTVPVSTEEPSRKSKRVKRPVKKTTKAPARGKGIKLLSQVALTKDAQFEEVRRKSMRDFHKTHPSGSGTATKPTPSAAIIKPSVTNERTGVKPGVPDKEDEEKIEDDEEEEDRRFIDTDKGFVQDEGIDAAMTYVLQGNENQDLSTKFLDFSDNPTTEAKIVSRLDIPVHHEVPSQQTPTLLIVPVSVISESSLVISTVIPQSLQLFTPPPLLSTPTPPPTTKATNPPSILPDFP